MKYDIGTEGFWWVRLSDALQIVVEIGGRGEDGKLMVWIPGHTSDGYDRAQFMIDNPDPENWKYIPNPWTAGGRPSRHPR